VLAFTLTAPILVVAATGGAAMWDDFWNWLPSAAYAYVQDSLPWPDLPPSASIFPGYPQRMPLMIAAASFVGESFLESAGPVINVALLAGSSALLAEAVAAALVRHGRLKATEMPLLLVASAVAITALLNPGLDGAVLLCAYADSGTMVAVGALALLGVEILARLSAAEPAGVEGLAWRFGFVGAMLINLKQANPALLALVTGGLVLIALRETELRTWRALLQLPRMLGPALVLFAAWRWYLRQAPSNAEPGFRPFNGWNFDMLDQTFASIGHVIVDAPLFHAMMWLVTAAGITAFFRLAAQIQRGALARGDLRDGLAWLQRLPVDHLSRGHERHRCSNGGRLLALYTARGAARTVRAGHGAGTRTLAQMDEPAGCGSYARGRRAGAVRAARAQRSQQSEGTGLARLHPGCHDRHQPDGAAALEAADRAGLEYQFVWRRCSLPPLAPRQARATDRFDDHVG